MEGDREAKIQRETVMEREGERGKSSTGDFQRERLFERGKCVCARQAKVGIGC